jgi:hypothetical protein
MIGHGGGKMIEEITTAYKEWRQRCRDRRAHRMKEKVKLIFFWEDVADFRAGKVTSEQSLARRLEFYAKVDAMSTDEILN